MENLLYILIGILLDIIFLVVFGFVCYKLSKRYLLFKSIVLSFIITYFFVAIPSLIYSLITYNGYCHHAPDISYPCSILRIIYESINPFISFFSFLGFCVYYVACFIIVSLVLCRKNKIRKEEDKEDKGDKVL